jgi:quercetin dioxygenase-like cupin family protein
MKEGIGALIGLNFLRGVPERLITESPTMPSITVSRIMSADVNSAGQTIEFPRERGHVDVAIYEILPGAILPVHKHIFPRVGYVISGTLRVSVVKTRKSSIYLPGDFILEIVDEWHEGKNIGDNLVKLLVIDLIEAGSENTLMMPGQEKPNPVSEQNSAPDASPKITHRSPRQGIID